MTAIKLSVCTSSRCHDYDGAYCRECSHAIYLGHVTLAGRNYSWEYNPYHGPLFSCKAIGKVDWLPGARHPVWKAFRRWHTRHFVGKVKRRGGKAMSNRRGWRWLVLEVYKDARCCNQGGGLWYVIEKPTSPAPRGCVAHIPVVGSGCTAPMAWRDAWLKIEAERGGE